MRTEMGLHRILNNTARRHLHKAQRLLDRGNEGWQALKQEPKPVQRAYMAYSGLEMIAVDQQLLSYAR